MRDNEGTRKKRQSQRWKKGQKQRLKEKLIATKRGWRESKRVRVRESELEKE